MGIVFVCDKIRPGVNLETCHWWRFGL